MAGYGNFQYNYSHENVVLLSDHLSPEDIFRNATSEDIHEARVLMKYNLSHSTSIMVGTERIYIQIIPIHCNKMLDQWYKVKVNLFSGNQHFRVSAFFNLAQPESSHLLFVSYFQTKAIRMLLFDFFLRKLWELREFNWFRRKAFLCAIQGGLNYTSMDYYGKIRHHSKRTEVFQNLDLVRYITSFL